MIELLDNKRATLISPCVYPKCEECEKYSLEWHECTVPVVVSKQLLLILRSEIEQMKKDIKELDTALYDEILGQNRGAVKELYERVAYGLPADYDNSRKGALPELHVDKNGRLTVVTGDKKVEYTRIIGEK